MKKKVIVISICVILAIGIILGIIFYRNNNKISYNVLGNSSTYIEGKYTNTSINDSDSAKKSLEDIEQEINVNSITNDLSYTKQDNTNDSKINENNTLTQQEALDLIESHYGTTWKEIPISYEYLFKVKSNDNKEYYAIMIHSTKNYMYYGGEWLEEIKTDDFYAGTYYVCTTYSDNKVFVGKNERDYNKYSEGDTVELFMSYDYIDINNGIKTDESVIEDKTIKVGNYTIKCGTYNGIDAATGDILIINSDQTATLNGENYTYTVGKYDIAQDPSSSPNYVDAIIFEATSGKKSFTLSVGNDNNLYDELKCYVYNGN